MRIEYFQIKTPKGDVIIEVGFRSLMTGPNADVPKTKAFQRCGGHWREIPYRQKNDLPEWVLKSAPNFQIPNYLTGDGSESIFGYIPYVTDEDVTIFWDWFSRQF